VTKPGNKRREAVPEEKKTRERDEEEEEEEMEEEEEEEGHDTFYPSYTPGSTAWYRDVGVAWRLAAVYTGRFKKMITAGEARKVNVEIKNSIRQQQWVRWRRNVKKKNNFKFK